MDIKNALRSIIKSHEKDVLTPLYTPWGEALNSEHILEEYPRPQMVRQNYTILNGLWDYAITPKTNTVPPCKYDGQIWVPFSPESLLSGVNRQLKPDELLWYHRTLFLEKLPDNKRLLLHFGAIDQEAWIYVNGKLVAEHHNGYLSFTADITHAITSGENELLIKVSDVSDTSDFTRGKQKLKRGGIFYTAQSGIWQTVWYEWVPTHYIERIKITPDFDHSSVEISLMPADTTPDFHVFSDAYVEIFEGKNCICIQPMSKLSCQISLPAFKAWTPETPFLYSVKIYAGEDYFESYFAMRHFSIENDANDYPCFCLNHKPYFLNGVLDQAYWPDGLYTAPSDEALIYDIQTAKALGFNMMRKHIKIEAARWYYHCDRLGMIVWQDMVNGGTSDITPLTSYIPTLFPFLWGRIKDKHYKWFGRASKENRDAWKEECLETISQLYNIPSIAVWGPFNEAWGQFDANAVTDMIRNADSTRLIDQASGWYDQQGGDFISEHNYFRRLKSHALKTEGNLSPSRAFVLSEYGGYACHIPTHASLERSFGYRTYDTPEQFFEAYKKLMEQQVIPLKNQGLSGAVYTQLTDIEEEVNGLITYDRKVIKVPYHAPCNK